MVSPAHLGRVLAEANQQPVSLRAYLKQSDSNPRVKVTLAIVFD